MRRLHPLSAVFLALNRGVAGFFLPFFLVTFAAGAIDLPHPATPFVVGALGFFLAAGYGVAYYTRFGYELTEDTFDISSGVVARRSRDIPYRRIQNVDIKQDVLFNLLGMATVTIETAGGGGSEASLHFVSEGEASRLQREIRRRTATATETHRRSKSAAESDAAGSPVAEAGTDRNGVQPGERAGPDAPGSTDRLAPGGEYTQDSVGGFDSYRPRQLFALDARELLLYSFASFRPAATAALGFLFLFGTDFAIQYLIAATETVGGQAAAEIGSRSRYVLLSVVSMVHAIVITYVVSILYTFFSYYGFRLGKAGDDLVYERGLLQRYSGSIPLEKVQSVTITDNPLQRLIGYAGLWVETAGYGPDSNGGSQSAVPLSRLSHVHAFTERLTGVEAPTFDRPTTVARRRYAVRYSLVATVVVAIAFGITLITPLESWYFALALYLIAPPAAHLRWANLGYYVGEDHLIVREGFWSRQTSVIPYYRIQTISTRRSIFQRRLGLASVVVDTASSRTFFWSSPTIYDVELPIARDVHDTARERLQAALSARDADETTIGESL